jgi:hypothetical protein
MESLEGEGWAGTIAQEALEAATVIALDAHGSIDAEATGALPGEHVAGVELVEQPVGAEVPKHAPLNDALEPDPVLGLEEAGFVKVSLPVVTPVVSGEDAVDNDQVEVKVRVQRGGAPPTGAAATSPPRSRPAGRRR